MKLQELVSTLREHKEVSFFEGHKLEARAGSLVPMLTESLTRLLPADVDVHCGWQTSELLDEWRGRHEWWLVVADELVRIHAAVSSQEGRKEITVRVFPLHYAVPKIVLSYRQDRDERGERETLISMQLEVLLEGETLNPVASGRSIDALTGFASHLRKAIARACRGAAKGKKVIR